VGDGDISILRSIINNRAYCVYDRAWSHSERRLTECQEIVNRYLRDHALPAEKVCVIAVGSVGRREALEASDLDLIPILLESIAGFEEHDRAIREAIGEHLNVKVSKGEDLTRFQTVDELTHVESIGGDRDDSASLTKRTLILTEGAAAGGEYLLENVRRRVLDAYQKAERTRGRHVLSLCNDVARYYRTLCIEYKAKIDSEDKDWCTRNLKLRHSRKLWYFATMVALANAAQYVAETNDEHMKAMLDVLGQPPYLRLASALGRQASYAGRTVLESYAWFLEFMAVPDNREALAKVTHAQRYSVSPENPFPAMKVNSDLMHREMIGVLDSVDRALRDRILDWFLL